MAGWTWLDKVTVAAIHIPYINTWISGAGWGAVTPDGGIIQNIRTKCRYTACVAGRWHGNGAAHWISASGTRDIAVKTSTISSGGRINMGSTGTGAICSIAKIPYVVSWRDSIICSKPYRIVCWCGEIPVSSKAATGCNSHILTNSIAQKSIVGV